MERKEYVYLAAFAIILAAFAVFSTKVGFHDSSEYITLAKGFAGIDNVPLFSTHSLLYPLTISPFLKIWPSLTMIKLINSLWVFLIGVVLFIWLKNKKAFIIFAFSPLVWHISIQTTPVLPASFFFLLAFIFIKKEMMKHNLAYSGFFLGLSCAFYDPMILVSFFFVLVYFWKKEFSSLVKFVIFAIIGFLPRMTLDFYLFNMPFYSLIRYVGTNSIIALGLNSGISMYEIFKQPSGLLILIAISPFLFRFYKIDWQFYKKEIIFLGSIGLIFLIRAALIKYFLIIAVIIIIFLSKVLSEKEIKWHCIISVIIVGLMTFSYFMPNEETLVQKDINKIIDDNPNVKYLITYPENYANKMASFYWKNNPKFAWFQDYEASINNQTRIRSYDFDFDSRIVLKDRLVISASFNRFDNKTYDNFILISQAKEPISNFSVSKCYDYLCVYKPVS